MRVTFKEATLLKDIITAVSQVNDTVYMFPEENRIRFWTIDGAKIILLQVTVNEADLSDYERGDREVIPIAIKDFKKVVSKIKKGDTVTLELLPTDQLYIKLSGRYPLKIKIPLGIEEMPYAEVKGIEYDTTVVLYGILLNDIVKIMKDFTAELKIIALPEKIIFKAVSDEYELESELDPQHDLIKEYETVEGATAIYGIRYLLDIIKGIKANDLVKIEFGSTIPMHIKKYIGNDSIIEWWLAPRVEEED